LVPAPFAALEVDTPALALALVDALLLEPVLDVLLLLLDPQPAAAVANSNAPTIQVCRLMVIRDPSPLER
jgi:hypothetical protein